MAKKIVLTLNAENDRLSILKYYSEKTGSNKYSLNIFEELEHAFEALSLFPYSGRVINNNKQMVFAK
jgi:hypothetical protein